MPALSLIQVATVGIVPLPLVNLCSPRFGSHGKCT